MAEIVDRCTADLQAIVKYTNEIIELAKGEKSPTFQQELSSWITLYNVKAQSLNQGLAQIGIMLDPPKADENGNVPEATPAAPAEEEAPKKIPVKVKKTKQA